MYISYSGQNEGGVTTIGFTFAVLPESLDFILPPGDSNDERCASLTHIHHEMNQFFHSYLYLQDVITFKDTSIYDKFLHDALLECFLIHYRALICFFPNAIGNKMRSDDVLSVHYGFTQPITVTKPVWIYLFHFIKRRYNVIIKNSKCRVLPELRNAHEYSGTVRYRS